MARQGRREKGGRKAWREKGGRVRERKEITIGRTDGRI